MSILESSPAILRGGGAGIAGDRAESAFGYGCFVEPEWVLDRKLVWACREDWEQDENPVGEIVRGRNDRIVTVRQLSEFSAR